MNKFKLVLFMFIGISKFTISDGEVLCPGKDPGDYCDCDFDCDNNPSFCSCAEAQLCCNGGGGGGSIPTYPPGPFTPKYKNGVGAYKRCKKTVEVFGVTICYTRKAWKKGNRKKLNHIANVVAQFIDNDADGVADDPDLVRHMIDTNIYLFVPFNEQDNRRAPKPKKGFGQMTGIWQAVINSCSVPSNRGASDTDRSTWPAAVNNNGGCNKERDITVEEVHHLLATGAAEVYPDIWGESFSSEAGSLLEESNGNCGWGKDNDWTNPGGRNSRCSGTYAYDDKTCDEGCLVVEGVYWASATWLGGLYTTSQAKIHGNEWLMTVPDAGMKPLPSGYKNAKTLEEGAPELYNLVSDTTSPGHEWLPSIYPNGRYVVEG